MVRVREADSIVGWLKAKARMITHPDGLTGRPRNRVSSRSRGDEALESRQPFTQALG